ncbi:MAG: hypothetical protein ABIE03_01435 [Patescibacteria group bacterium]
MEIQIEGKDGWAAKLPTFRLKRKVGIKPVTGYHFFILLFTLIIFHFPAFFTIWSVKKELLLLGAYIFMLTLEDFLWFILNPYYGLKKFNKNNPDIWWHESWFAGLPSFYWYLFPLAVIFIALGI